MRKQSGSRQRHFHGPDTGFEEIGVQTVFRSANFLEADSEESARFRFFEIDV